MTTTDRPGKGQQPPTSSAPPSPPYYGPPSQLPPQEPPPLPPHPGPQDPIAQDPIGKIAGKTGFSRNMVIIFAIGAAVLLLIIVIGIANRGPSGYNNPTTLGTSVAQQVNAKEGTGPNGGNGTFTAICVQQQGTQFVCNLSDPSWPYVTGGNFTLNVTVAANGQSWVSSNGIPQQ